MSPAKKATLAQVRRYAKRIGAILEVERYGDDLTIYADAPEGKTWKATGGTVLVAHTKTCYFGWEEEECGALLDEMKDGLS